MGVNLHVSLDASVERELISLHNESPPSTVLNPTYGDLRVYVETACKLSGGMGVVFVDLLQPECFVCELDSLKDAHPSIRLFAVELPSGESGEPQSSPPPPMIHIVAVNVCPAARGQAGVRAHGLPFALATNRDCSYAELCRKLLEAQLKLFVDRSVVKYRVSGAPRSLALAFC